MASPVATALKQQNPNTQVSWLVSSELAPLLEDHPSIDNLITFNLNEWEDQWQQKNIYQLIRMTLSLRRELRALKLDKTIDLQGTFTTGVIAGISGARHRIALGSTTGNSLFMTKTISKNLGDQLQIGSEYRYLVNQLGCPDTPWEMHTPQRKNTSNHIQALIENQIGCANYATIVPFARHPQKNWPDDYWEQIILRLRGRYQLRTIIIGGQNGEMLGEQIAKRCGALSLAGKTTLSETAEIIRNANIVIGVDTGLTHMGHALKTPTISLFGATSPYSHTENDFSKVIYMDRFCSPCRRTPTCNGRYDCMREITPDKVLTAIKPLMKSNLKPQPLSSETRNQKITDY